MKDEPNKTEPLSEQAREQLKTLAGWLGEARRVCVFTGAGVSCPSGIPDFRSANGIYNQRDKTTYAPEEMVSHDFFCTHTEDFFDFYRRKMVWPSAQPNAAHRFFAGLEKGREVTVVTQNIDGLHQAAGSTHVLELHGSVHRNHCTRCGAFYGLEAITETDRPVPRCARCGGVIKPDVVLYGESLDSEVISAAVDAIAAADVLLVSGTSLAVYPAASFVGYYGGSRLAVLNRTPTPIDARANLAVYADAAAAAEELGRLMAQN